MIAPILITPLCLSFLHGEQRVAADVRPVLSEVESLYLQFSFDDAPPCLSHGVGAVGEAPKDPQLTLVPEMRARLEQSLLSVADHLLNCYSPEVRGAKGSGEEVVEVVASWLFHHCFSRSICSTLYEQLRYAKYSV